VRHHADRENKVITMLRYNECEASRKTKDAHVGDDDVDVALILAARFHMEPHLARLIARLAGLGGDAAAA
jgi:hypothetical protein